MPRATRKTKTNKGTTVRALKPNTLSNTTALTPSAATNDSTTVAIRITGAKTALSSRPRMMNTTSRISGMITLRSCVEACATS